MHFMIALRSKNSTETRMQCRPAFIRITFNGEIDIIGHIFLQDKTAEGIE